MWHQQSYGHCPGIGKEIMLITLFESNFTSLVLTLEPLDEYLPVFHPPFLTTAPCPPPQLLLWVAPNSHPPFLRTIENLLRAVWGDLDLGL